MDATQHDPSSILAQARRHLEALKNSGLSRAELLALLEEDDQQSQQQPQQHVAQPQYPPPAPPQQQQQQQPSPQQSQPQNQQQQGAVDGLMPPSFTWNPSHQVRSSISSTASNSSGHESILSTATGKTVSSVSSVATGRSTSSSTSEAKYWCTSCDKTFKRKFDWKRHEEEFHERWRKYPCPNCNQSFWGPNTFNQHHKSAHGCKTCPHSDNVVKYMRKRRAWGCGFCAAMHGKLEKHYEHVASHFEQGSAKGDWLHSNVIYGLLHQPAVLEAWRDLVSKKQHKFNGHQPMFSWSPDNTGRAQGYVENESPGQLQDFLEFFGGSKESAEKIARCAWGYCHVVLKPKQASGGHEAPASSSSSSQETITTSSPPQEFHANQVSITSQRNGLRRTASTSLMPVTRQQSRRVASTDFFDRTSQIPMTSPIEPSQPNPNHNAFHTFQVVPSQSVPSQPMQPIQTDPMQIQINSSSPLLLDKELPPAPLLPSPMDVDFHMFDAPPHQHHNPSMLKAPGMVDSDWQSLTSTLIGDHAMAAQIQSQQPHNHHFPMSWENLGQFDRRVYE